MPDLSDITGLPDLWVHTRGDPRLIIAVLDGPADLTRACFRGARLTAQAPYWQDPIPIDPADLAAFLLIRNENTCIR